MKVPYKKIDANGAKLRKGDRVRIVGVPDLSQIADDDELHTREVFKHLRGTVKYIRGFDNCGNAEIFFKIRNGPLGGWHGVCIEPWLLLRQEHGHKA
jgi:hypothetical protein